MRLLTLCRSAKADDFIERIVHHVVETLIHFTLAPRKKPWRSLDPFEIADGDAAGVAKNVLAR